MAKQSYASTALQAHFGSAIHRFPRVQRYGLPRPFDCSQALFFIASDGPKPRGGVDCINPQSGKEGSLSDLMLAVVASAWPAQWNAEAIGWLDPGAAVTA